MPALRRRDQALQIGLVQPIDVFECVEHRETRLDAEKHGGVAMGQVQVNQQRRLLGCQRAATSPD